jgi:hypothetical protein
VEDRAGGAKASQNISANVSAEAGRGWPRLEAALGLIRRWQGVLAGDLAEASGRLLSTWPRNQSLMSRVTGLWSVGASRWSEYESSSFQSLSLAFSASASAPAARPSTSSTTTGTETEAAQASLC